MFDRRLLKDFDWSILLITFSLLIVGFLSLYSALNVKGYNLESSPLFLRQLYWIGIGIFSMIIILTIDYQAFQSFSYLLYGIGIISLVYVLLFGVKIGGAKRWINLFGIFIQPSEFMKIIVIMALARYFSLLESPNLPNIKELLPACVLIILPVLLIAKQPDLGTALTILLVSISIAAFVGIRKKYYIIGSIFCLVSLYPIWHFCLRAYQKNRMKVLFGFIKDSRGLGYHIRQSEIAIGSGTLFGKGFLHGTQHLLQFLPEHHTDFIFSVWAEEWGFVGCACLIVLYLGLILLGLKVARRAKNKFGSLLAFGVTAMIFWQVTINIGMVLGLLPVVGITLPLVSYGGSSMLTMLLSIGILLNISMRKYVFE